MQLPDFYEVKAELDSMERQYGITPTERDLLEWASGGILGYLTNEEDAWLPEPDGYEGNTIRQACSKEFVYRLGEQLPAVEESFRWNEATTAAETSKSRRQAQIGKALAERIAQQEGVTS